MPVRLKKLVGTVLLVVLVLVYAIVATIVAVAQLAESGPLVHLAFFLFTGLLWVCPRCSSSSGWPAPARRDALTLIR